MISLSRGLRISRPRFWMYLLGPYLLGVTAANPPLGHGNALRLILFALYFTLPANLMVYGVNDICDYDTDRLNPKKQTYEALVLPTERRGVLVLIALVSAPFAALLAWHVPIIAIAYLGAFVALSIFYSLPPIRAKARPVIDSLFNVLYAMPGFFGWALAGGGTPSVPIAIAALAWTMAMHAFSAVPDIDSDREAGLATVATLIGRQATILTCLALYIASAVLSFPSVGPIAAILGVVYAALMIASLTGRADSHVMRIYRVFPVVNTVAGALLFAVIFASKHLKV